MKSDIIQLINAALSQLVESAYLSNEALLVTPIVDRTRQKEHGDFAVNIAMQLAKSQNKSPRDIAQNIIDAIPSSDMVAKIEIAGPGFINFHLTQQAQYQVLKTIAHQGDDYGHLKSNSDEKVTVEFISANPTGPLHVGHGRGAAYGDSLSRLLTAAGRNVHKEYYVNDAGRQMDIMALSVWLRYLEQMGDSIAFPSNGYQGDYIKDIAAKLAIEYEEDLLLSMDGFDDNLPEDDELRIDELIHRCKQKLGDEKYAQLFAVTLNTQLDQIKEDLSEFEVTFDEWFSERKLHDIDAVEKAIEQLQSSGYLYEKDDALWFKSSELGDEKDRVIQRANGAYTYFASDIAYMLNKIERGFTKLIYVWGADHHGYVPRVKAAFKALGQDPEKMEVLLVQFAILYRNGQKVSMSTRSGEFVTLEDLRDEVGRDASRFFYCMRKPEQHMDFDLDLAKEQSNENPVYYVQYAHARICSILRQAPESFDNVNVDDLDLTVCDTEIEQELISHLAKYPEIISAAADQYEPHQVAYYLRELAALFHSFYNSVKILADDQDDNTLHSRLVLIDSTRQVFDNGLSILGVSAPEHM